MGTIRIKICGVTRVEDVRAAAHLGADALGLNFYPSSPRYVGPKEVPRLLEVVPPFVEAVGVFVSKRLSDIAIALRGHDRLRVVQWHGEPAQREIDVAWPFEVITAFSIRDRDSLEEIRRYLADCGAMGRLPAALLLDAHVQGEYGGTGKTAPWELLTDFRPGVPVILAGGLTPENVAEAIRRVRPYAVDVASGVESAPGLKDVEKMRRFIGEARNAAASLSLSEPEA